MISNAHKITLFLLLFISAPLFAEMPMFWKVEGKTNTVYLLGTIHVGKESFYPMAKPIEEAYNSVEHLVLESDTIDFKAKENSKTFKKCVSYPKDSSISIDLPQDTYIRLIGAMDDAGYTMRYYKHLRPAYLFMIIEGKEASKTGYKPEFGVEKYLLKRRKGKKVHSLENLEIQLTMFNNIHTVPYIEHRIKSLKSKKMQSDMSNLAEAWQRGDSAFLHNYSINLPLKYLPDGDNFVMEMLYKRNYEMVRRLSPMFHAGKDVFVAVGAAHFLGEHGIIEILKKKGYKPVRVTEDHPEIKSLKQKNETPSKWY